MGNLINFASYFGILILSILSFYYLMKKELKFEKYIIVIMMSFVLLSGCAVTPPSSPSRTEQSKNISSNTTDNISQSNSTNNEQSSNTNASDNNSTSTEKITNNSDGSNKDSTTLGELKIHFIDVGQADSILIQNGDISMLIDAGNNADSETVISYIKKQGIDKLDFLVGTHPHEDHIGALDSVIKNFQIGKIYMPKVSNTTKTFTDVLNAIKDKGLKVSTPVPGSNFKLGDAYATILAPNGNSYEDLNDNSIVIKLTFGNTSFIFEGDAEVVSEKEMIDKGFDLSADLIKIGHHGSSSSTSSIFLSNVNPKYAVIMVGKDNTYGHPHKSTMDSLKEKGIKVYRTDENGTIVATSDGKTITFNTEPGSYKYNGTGSSSSDNTTTSGTSVSKSSSGNTSVVTPTSKTSTNSDSNKTVYFTPSGKSYHFNKECRTLSRSKTILTGTLQQAIHSGHADPCDVCTN